MKKAILVCLGLYAAGVTVLYVRSQSNLHRVSSALEMIITAAYDVEFAKIVEGYDN